jgi:hypothetical protein
MSTWMKFEMDELFGWILKIVCWMKMADDVIIWISLDNMGGWKR